MLDTRIYPLVSIFKHTPRSVSLTTEHVMLKQEVKGYSVCICACVLACRSVYQTTKPRTCFFQKKSSKTMADLCFHVLVAQETVGILVGAGISSSLLKNYSGGSNPFDLAFPRHRRYDKPCLQQRAEVVLPSMCSPLISRIRGCRGLVARVVFLVVARANRIRLHVPLGCRRHCYQVLTHSPRRATRAPQTSLFPSSWCALREGIQSSY